MEILISQLIPKYLEDSVISLISLLSSVMIFKLWQFEDNFFYDINSITSPVFASSTFLILYVIKKNWIHKLMEETECGSENRNTFNKTGMYEILLTHFDL